MPTATSLSGYSLLNIGPATTAFTAPTSCASAYGIQIAPSAAPSLAQYNANCSYVPAADCFPSGSLINSIVASAKATNPNGSQLIPYQSPGIVCPSGQVTVGVAEKLSPTSSKLSGDFNLTLQEDSAPRVPIYQPWQDVLASALVTGETAILCCPSSYTAVRGQCISAIPKTAYIPTVGCQNVLATEQVSIINGTFTIEGQVITAGLLSVTGTAPWSISTTTFSPEDVSSLVGVAVKVMGVLVHQSSDMPVASATPSGSASNAMTTPAASMASTAPTASSTSSTSAALRMHRIGNVRGIVATMWCLSFMVRANLVL